MTQVDMSERWPQSIPGPKGPRPEERWERFELCPRFERTVVAFLVCWLDLIRSLGNSRFIVVGFFILFYFEIGYHVSQAGLRFYVTKFTMNF